MAIMTEDEFTHYMGLDLVIKQEYTTIKNTIYCGS